MLLRSLAPAFLLLAVICSSIAPAAAAPSTVSPANTVPYDEARFSYSKDPAKALLHVAAGGGMSTIRRSMTLYGDGRIRLLEKDGNELRASFEISVPREEIVRLLGIAVDHGLAEWDSTRIRAELLEKNQGHAFSAPEDFPSVLVLLSIENYQRGSYEVDHVEKELRFRGARFFAPHFPSMPEVAGIGALHEELNELFAKARALQEQGR